MKLTEGYSSSINALKKGLVARKEGVNYKLKALEKKVLELEKKTSGLDNKTDALREKTSRIEKKSNQHIEATGTLFKFLNNKIKKLFDMTRALFQKVEKRAHKNTLLLDCSYSENPLIKEIISMKQILAKYEKDFAKGHEKFEEIVWNHFEKTNKEIQGVCDSCDLEQIYYKFRKDFFGEVNSRLQSMRISLVKCGREYLAMNFKSAGGYHNAEALKNLGIDEENLKQLSHKAAKLQLTLNDYTDKGVTKNVMARIDAFRYKEQKGEQKTIELEKLKEEFFELAGQFDEYHVSEKESNGYIFDELEYKLNLTCLAGAILKHELADEKLKEKVGKASEQALAKLEEIERYHSNSYRPRFEVERPLERFLQYNNPKIIKDHKILLEEELARLEKTNQESRIGEKEYEGEKSYLEGRIDKLDEYLSDSSKYQGYIVEASKLYVDIVGLETRRDLLDVELNDLSKKVQNAKEQALKDKPSVEVAEKKLDKLEKSRIIDGANRDYANRLGKVKKEFREAKKSLDKALKLTREYKERKIKIKGEQDSIDSEIYKLSRELRRVKAEKAEFEQQLGLYAEEYTDLRHKQVA